MKLYFATDIIQDAQDVLHQMDRSLWSFSDMCIACFMRNSWVNRHCRTVLVSWPTTLATREQDFRVQTAILLRKQDAVWSRRALQAACPHVQEIPLCMDTSSLAAVAACEIKLQMLRTFRRKHIAALPSSVSVGGVKHEARSWLALFCKQAAETCSAGDVVTLAHLIVAAFEGSLVTQQSETFCRLLQTGKSKPVADQAWIAGYVGALLMPLLKTKFDSMSRKAFDTGYLDKQLDITFLDILAKSSAGSTLYTDLLVCSMHGTEPDGMQMGALALFDVSTFKQRAKLLAIAGSGGLRETLAPVILLLKRLHCPYLCLETLNKPALIEAYCRYGFTPTTPTSLTMQLNLKSDTPSPQCLLTMIGSKERIDCSGRRRRQPPQRVNEVSHPFAPPRLISTARPW